MFEDKDLISSAMRVGAFFVFLGVNLTGADDVMAQSETFTVTGVRTTQGNAVDCPELRTQDGRTISVFGLPATIGIGERVRITGMMVNPTTCLGPALNAETVERL
jgi:hypothetical protein